MPSPVSVVSNKWIKWKYVKYVWVVHFLSCINSGHSTFNCGETRRGILMFRCNVWCSLKPLWKVWGSSYSILWKMAPQWPSFSTDVNPPSHLNPFPLICLWLHNWAIFCRSTGKNMHVDKGLAYHWLPALLHLWKACSSPPRSCSQAQTYGCPGPRGATFSWEHHPGRRRSHPAEYLPSPGSRPGPGVPEPLLQSSSASHTVEKSAVFSVWNNFQSSFKEEEEDMLADLSRVKHIKTITEDFHSETAQIQTSNLL